MTAISTRLTLMGIVSAVFLTACAGTVTDRGPLATGDPTEPTTTEPTAEPDNGTSVPTTEPAPKGTVDLALYFMADSGGTKGRRGPFLIPVQRTVPATQAVLAESIRQLIAGPSTSDRDLVAGVSSAVPAGTLLLGASIANGTATIDLSREFESGGGSFSMFSRLSQVVYTATQFATVDRVVLHLDGSPVRAFSAEGIVLDGPISRDDYLDLVPTILVDSPAAGANLASGDHITGIAAVFEAVFQYRLTDASGKVLAEGFTMTSEGQGWGTFDLVIDYSIAAPQDGTLTVWEESAEDGSVQAERSTPVRLTG